MVTEEFGPDVDVRALCVNDLPLIKPERAAAFRLFNDPRFLKWLAEAYEINIRHVSDAVVTGSHLKVSLRCPGGNLELSFSEEVLPVLGLAVAADAAGGPAIATIVASRLLAPLVEQFSKAAKQVGDLRWHSVGVSAIGALVKSNRKPVESLASFEVLLKNRLITNIELLSADPAVVRALQDMIDAKQVLQYPAMSTWRIPSALCLATRRWKSSILCTLEVGDVLLCKENASLDDISAQLYCGVENGKHWVGRVQINQQEVTMTSQIEVQQSGEDGAGESWGPPLTANVADLEVPVRFEIDSAALSIAQLASLRPGYVIELSIPVDQAEIRLVSCGQLIGRGKLVVVGDCLGVQLVQLTIGNP